MRDGHARSVDYLRLSLTAACQMRCCYCRVERLRVVPDECLTASEIEFVVRHLVRRGVKKVRLTGGEPALRSDLLEIIERLGRVGLTDLTMTTNGVALARHAGAYLRAGLRRVNVSLDTVDPRRFANMTGLDVHREVVEGIEVARRVGLPLRLNTVVVRGENEDELQSLVEFAADRGLAIRFIELMPMGPMTTHWARRFVPQREIQQRLSVALHTALPRGSDSAQHYRAFLADGREVVIGFIAPMSCNFCGCCARLRIDSRGDVYPCLMGPSVASVLPALRPRRQSGELHRIVARVLSVKPAQHAGRGVVSMGTVGG